MSSSSDIRPDEHSVPPTGRRREPVAGAESCCGICPSKRLELEQGLDRGTQASVGVCEEKGSRETHSSQGAFAQGHIHGSGRKRRKERKKEEERDGIGTSLLRVVVKFVRRSNPGKRPGHSLDRKPRPWPRLQVLQAPAPLCSRLPVQWYTSRLLRWEAFTKVMR
jgi:hypothetical protein